MSARQLQKIEVSKAKTRQFSTFYIGEHLYGIDVIQVQEVTKSLPITPIHLAPGYIKGLINLRGQIATVIGLSELFKMDSPDNGEKMAVVCKYDGMLLSLLVDHIGDVIEVSDDSFEASPETVPDSVRRFMTGVYKIPDSILSVIEINKLFNALAK